MGVSTVYAVLSPALLTLLVYKLAQAVYKDDLGEKTSLELLSFA